MLRVVTATVFEMDTKSPVPVNEAFNKLFEFIETVPVPPLLMMPVYTEAPEPYMVQFCMILLEIDIVPVADCVIPLNVQAAVVVPFVPTVIEFDVEVLPIVLPDIV